MGWPAAFARSRRIAEAAAQEAAQAQQGAGILVAAGNRGLDGCWQCPDFLCGSGIFFSVRSRAFIQYIQIHGVEALLDRLAENEAAAVRYHDPGKLTGDYDRCTDESEVIAMLEGKTTPCQPVQSPL